MGGPGGVINSLGGLQSLGEGVPKPWGGGGSPVPWGGPKPWGVSLVPCGDPLTPGGGLHSLMGGAQALGGCLQFFEGVPKPGGGPLDLGGGGPKALGGGSP